MGTPIWMVSAENCFGWFVFGLLFSIGFNLVGYPFRRWSTI